MRGFPSPFVLARGGGAETPRHRFCPTLRPGVSAGPGVRAGGATSAAGAFLFSIRPSRGWRCGAGFQAGRGWLAVPPAGLAAGWRIDDDGEHPWTW